MLKPQTRTLIFALLLILSTGQAVCAETKLYKYDGKLPFVEMMLNMMSVMGIIDRVPAGMLGGYGGYPNAGISNPYMRALAMRGISPTALSSLQNPYARNQYGSNPFSRSPWLQSPWTQAGTNGLSPLWSSPEWGVLPVDSYLHHSTWDNYGPYGVRDNRYNTVPYWSADDITGWVNEPWETSTWNPDVNTSRQSQYRAPQQPPPTVVQNFNYAAPSANDVMDHRSGQNAAEGNRQNNAAYNSSPLAKLAPGGAPPDSQYRQQRRPSPLARHSTQNTQNRPGNMGDENPAYKAKNAIRQKLCVTEFCGLKKPDLNGLWVAQDGEMLGVNNQRYLWADTNSRYLTGQMIIENEYLVANVDGVDTVMRFKYKLAGDHLLTMRPDGTVREFTRMSREQYLRAYQSGYYQ